MTIILGTASQGPVEVANERNLWSEYTNKTYARVDLSSSGIFTVPTGTTSYRFVGFSPLNYWETTPKPTGGTNEYRMKGFPIVPSTFTIQQDGVYLTRDLTGSPSSGKYFIDEPSGLLRLGDSSTDLVIRYTGNTGTLKEFSPLEDALIDDVLSWTSSTIYDEVWVEMTPAPGEGDLITCFNRGNYPVDTYALRCDGGTPALCTISANSIGTMVLSSEVGTAGNNWRVCWDTDAIYLLKPPGYVDRKVSIPLSNDAASILRGLAYPTTEELGYNYSELFATCSGNYALTSGTLATFTGGTSSATFDWYEKLSFIGTESDLTLIPLGLTSITPVEIFLEESLSVGVWPIVVLGSTTEISGNHPNLAICAGTVTYKDGYQGTLLHAFGAALANGAPYYLPSVSECSPRGTDPQLIYGVESVRHGWVVTSHPMVSGDLYLNHHVWIQGLVGSLRDILEKYIGQVGVTSSVIGTDPDLVRVMNKYGATYMVTVEGKTVEVGVKVTPPGAISEVRLDVRRSA